MNAYEEARATLFRAMLGEKPIPTAEEVVQAKNLLHNSPEFRAGLDALVDVVLSDKRPLEEQSRNRLQAYVAAQLAGTAATLEFAEIKQRLDADVALSEEYALLYETMQHEQQGTLPLPLAITPLKLDFLVVADKAPMGQRLGQRIASKSVSIPAWRQALHGLKFTWLRVVLGSDRSSFGRRGRSAVLAGLLITLFVSVWSIARPAPHLIDSPHVGFESREQPSSFFKQQMQLEGSSPAMTLTQTEEAIQDANECPQISHGGLIRNICKL